MKFKSVSAGLRLIIEPQQEIRVGREVSITPGLRIEFKDGIFETEDKELIAKLKSLPNYRRDFQAVEKKAQPKRVAPKSRKGRSEEAKKASPRAPKEDKKLKIKKENK